MIGSPDDGLDEQNRRNSKPRGEVKDIKEE